MENPAIASEKVKIERKLFFFDLHENPRGQFLRITEDVRGRRDTIIVPTTGLLDFRDALDSIIDTIDPTLLDDDDEYEYEDEVEVEVEEKVE